MVLVPERCECQVTCLGLTVIKAGLLWIDRTLRCIRVLRHMSVNGQVLPSLCLLMILKISLFSKHEDCFDTFGFSEVNCDVRTSAEHCQAIFINSREISIDYTL